MAAPMVRKSYSGVVATVPVSIPYERYSIESAHWWIGRALRALAQGAGISHREIDGFAMASFSTAPDSAIGLTQHLGLSPRWLDHIPMGGVSGILSLRRAARAVQAGDADIVACVAGDTNQVDTFRRTLEKVRAGCRLSLRRGRRQCQLRPDRPSLHGSLRGEAGGLRQALRGAADQRAAQSECAHEKNPDARAIHECATDCRSDPSFRLRHALRRRGGFPRHARGDGAVAGPAQRAHPVDHRASPCVFR